MTEFEYDMTINNVADSCNELYRMIGQVPHDKIFETKKTIEDAIAMLVLSATKIEERKI